jgi:hypothetical protein
MQEIFTYMQELVKYLNYLEVPVEVENYRNITLRAVMIFYSPIGSRDSKIS